MYKYITSIFRNHCSVIIKILMENNKTTERKDCSLSVQFVDRLPDRVEIQICDYFL